MATLLGMMEMTTKGTILSSSGDFKEGEPIETVLLILNHAASLLKRKDGGSTVLNKISSIYTMNLPISVLTRDAFTLNTVSFEDAQFIISAVVVEGHIIEKIVVKKFSLV